MKRFLTVLLLFVFLLGCANTNTVEDEALMLRRKLAKAQGCSFQSHITADFGELSYSFTLKNQVDKDGKLTFEVVAPESIAQITGTVSAAGGKLTFDDKALAFPLLAQGEISPVAVPWLVIRSIRGGYIRCVESTEGTQRITYDDSISGETVQVDIWLDDKGLPQYGEVFWQGRRILTLRMDDFVFL